MSDGNFKYFTSLCKGNINVRELILIEVEANYPWSLFCFTVQYTLQSPVPPDSPMNESPGLYKPAQLPQPQYWVRTYNTTKHS
jgi:hypothetical protein